MEEKSKTLNGRKYLNSTENGSKGVNVEQVKP